MSTANWIALGGLFFTFCVLVWGMFSFYSGRMNSTKDKIWDSLNLAHQNHADLKHHISDHYAKKSEVDDKLAIALENLGNKMVHNVELMNVRLGHIEQSITRTEEGNKALTQLLPEVTTLLKTLASNKGANQ